MSRGAWTSEVTASYEAALSAAETLIKHHGFQRLDDWFKSGLPYGKQVKIRKRASGGYQLMTRVIAPHPKDTKAKDR